MKNRKYASLLKTRKFQLNQKRRKMTTLQQLREELQNACEAIDRDLAKNNAGAGGESEARFIEGAVKRRNNIAKSIDRIDKSLECERSELNDDFRSFKEIEIISSTPHRKGSSLREIEGMAAHLKASQGIDAMWRHAPAAEA